MNERQRGIAVGRALAAAARQDRVTEVLLSVAAPDMPDEKALEIADAWPAWAQGAAYRQGQVVAHAGALYRVRQDANAQAHQPPNAAGMLAVYAPIQREAAPGEVLPWVYGETGIKVGDKRGFGGKVYQAVQAPGANVWEPPNVPAVWKVSP